MNSFIRDEAAYESARARRIISNARKTFERSHERAAEVIGFLQVDVSDEVCTLRSEFLLSLRSALRTYGKLSPKQMACALASIDRRAEQRQQRQIAAELAAQINEKIEADVRLIRTFESNHPVYGTSFLYVMVDDENHKFSWRTRTWLGVEDGDRLRIHGTVKAKTEYRGEPQTELTRVKRIDE